MSGENSSGAWSTEQAAIIHAKLSQKDEEIALPKRWLARCPKAHRAGSRIGERLAKPMA